MSRSQRLLIDAAQLGSSSLYAYLLQRYARRLTADTTWMQVVAGDAMCLAYASARLRVDPPTSPEQAERAVWRSFVMGGLPIILWQLKIRTDDHRASFTAVIKSATEDRVYVERDDDITP